MEIKDTAWSLVVARKIRQQLDQLSTRLKETPARLRQYAGFEYLQNILKAYQKTTGLIAELKSEALRERHWKTLFRNLGLEGRVAFAELSLGVLWDIDLIRNESKIKDVLLVAQGEMALEEYLRQVREFWQGYELELVNYQNKCRLIKGWDEIFEKSREHLGSLGAMKHSPYYKEFELEASSWDDKLNRLLALFDMWIDVQRQWVYLEGIFNGNPDIKNMLPAESAKFQNINTEFYAVMKKVYKTPNILEVLAIPGILRSLERLAELLSKIQKALGEYLERERAACPRFYFVGDEDLLEIIGNSKDLSRIQKHFKKMFAGIYALSLNDDDSAIIGVASKEGEQLVFRNQVQLKDVPKINVWLAQLESEMRHSLAGHFADAFVELEKLMQTFNREAYMTWLDMNLAQTVLLASQVFFTHAVEAALDEASQKQTSQSKDLERVASVVDTVLAALADSVVVDQAALLRRKCEHIITELVHQRDVLRGLIRGRVFDPKSFDWLYQMRFYYSRDTAAVLERVEIRMANARFFYGYEYLGIIEKLVQTPLTDRCYLTLTQALNARLGGSPFGPAGTGKTESVKALGAQLGRFVLVFCCDESFDFQAMGRIFIGLCQVGAWGCFDEFNRLEERILSAVSQQIQTIQTSLRETKGDARPEISLVGRSLKVHLDTGIFITMNPGYAGRSNLPDNLKKLFRSIAMTKPDRELIAQVMLYSQGFRTAELLAAKVVPFFKLCEEQLSPQSHYDFGLRALKSVLVSAGNLKRASLQGRRASLAQDAAASGTELGVLEQRILIQSIRETVFPKLISEDIVLIANLLSDVFPGVQAATTDTEKLRAGIGSYCQKHRLVASDEWTLKVLASAS